MEEARGRGEILALEIIGIVYLTGFVICLGGPLVAFAILASLGEMNSDYWTSSDEKAVRNLCRMIFLSPVWPVIVGYWVVFGIKKAWKYTEWEITRK